METELEFKNKPTKLQKEIIKTYWKLKGDKFKNKPSNIKNKYNLQKRELNAIIRNYSYLVIKGPECNSCGIERFYFVYSQREFREFCENPKFDCMQCEDPDLEKFYSSQYESIMMLFNSAFPN